MLTNTKNRRGSKTVFFGVKFFKQIPHLQRLLQVVILYRKQVENTQKTHLRTPIFFLLFLFLRKMVDGVDKKVYKNLGKWTWFMSIF
jgi:hypothetical protein